jgi:ATP-dependent 26S proteasome regulatory subunit
MLNPLERLKLLIDSHTPIVVMETVEEHRAVQIARLAANALGMPVFEWSVADGLQRLNAPPQPSFADYRTAAPVVNFTDPNLLPGTAALDPRDFTPSGPLMNTQQPAHALAHIETLTIEGVFIFKDIHRHLEDLVVTRRIRDVAAVFSRSRSTLLLMGPTVKLPPELEKQVEYVDLPLPNSERLRQIVEESYERLNHRKRLKRSADDAALGMMANNMLGLTEDEAERAITQALVKRYTLSADLLPDLIEAKKDILRRSDMLEFVDPIADLDSVGGLDNLKSWLRQRRGAWEPAAKEFGLEPPRGVIIMGVQGCGKSMACRALAGDWKLPLVKFDTAAVYDKFIGETEKRIKKVLLVAEQLAPVVLWVDELEKVFAGAGPDSASVDAGVSARVLGTFLSWMQDRKAPVFVAATSNNVEMLPPELIRKGRFDEIFFVDLPNPQERLVILRLHLARRKRNPAEFDLPALVEGSSGFSGAEIEAAVQSGMYAAFAEKKPLVTAHLLKVLQTTVPLSETREEDIRRLRHWARERAVPATSQPEQASAGLGFAG